MVNKTIAIIPARGGSKRVPKKNIINFLDKPMIAWTIEAAIKSKCFDYIMVNTDDPDIAEIAQQHGAEVPFLRHQHCDDFSSVSDVTFSTLTSSIIQDRFSFDQVVQLMPNCPFRNEHDIINALSYFEKNRCNFLISSFKYGWTNPWWAHTQDHDRAIPLFPDALKSRSQDLPKLLCPTGAIWIANIDAFLEHKTFYGPNYKFYQLDMLNAIDIDDYEDIKFAKGLYYANNNVSQNH
ncbi:MAG: acylneuraminate cytidylyltransferase family protein [Coxiellaceae bacterium]|nr:acylneuraminate cytidylyltransferase family protein [Coxiellaceae bacterium]